MVGCDVSNFQKIEKTENIERVIVRAGWGQNNIDPAAEKHAEMLGDKVVGWYWFSYALNLEMVTREADYICDFCDAHNQRGKVIAFDMEGDSEQYANTKGVTYSRDWCTSAAICFLQRVKSRGYVPMLYSNVDWLKRRFDLNLIDREVGGVLLWLAYWSATRPLEYGGHKVSVHQYTNEGRVDGISGNVDLDIFYDGAFEIKSEKETEQPETEQPEYKREVTVYSSADLDIVIRYKS